MHVTCPKNGNVFTWPMSVERDTLIGDSITLNVIITRTLIVEASTEPTAYDAGHEQIPAEQQTSNPELNIREQVVIALENGKELSVTYHDDPTLKSNR